MRLIALGLLATVAFSATALAAPAIVVSPVVGHPKIATQVSGTGFVANEAVDVYFDTTDKFLAVTNASGSFSAHELDVPKDALPGSHWVTAVGRKTGDAAQTTFLVRTNWPQYGFDLQHRGRNPYENVINASNVGTLGEAWSYTTGGQIYSSPAYNGGLIYFGSLDHKVYALTATGQLKWSATTGGEVYSSPTWAGGNVYVGATDNKVYAFNGSTGAPVWSAATGGAIYSSPTVVGNSLYIGSLDSKVYALNAATGAALWSTATGGQIIYSSPAIAKGTVYIGSNDFKLYALNASTGGVLWTVTTGNSIYSSPTVAGGAVFFGCLDGKVYAVNAKTGVVIWTYTTGSGVASSPAALNNSVFIGSNDGYVYALDAARGLVKWSTFLAGAVDLGSVAIANGVGYIGANGNNRVEAFDPDTGYILGSATTAAPIESRPVVVDGKLYVSSWDQNLYAYALDGGNNAVYKPRQPPAYASLHPDHRLKPLK